MTIIQGWREYVLMAYNNLLWLQHFSCVWLSHGMQERCCDVNYILLKKIKTPSLYLSRNRCKKYLCFHPFEKSRKQKAESKTTVQKLYYAKTSASRKAVSGFIHLVVVMSFNSRSNFQKLNQKQPLIVHPSTFCAHSQLGGKIW